jgi:hypothetical protein
MGSEADIVNVPDKALPAIHPRGEYLPSPANAEPETPWVQGVEPLQTQPRPLKPSVAIVAYRSGRQSRRWRLAQRCRPSFRLVCRPARAALMAAASAAQKG